MHGNRLLQPILHIGAHRSVGLLGRCNQLRSLLEFIVEPIQRLVGQVNAVTGDHRLRLGEPGTRQLEVITETVRGSEGECAPRMFQRALDRIQGRVRQAVR